MRSDDDFGEDRHKFEAPTSRRAVRRVAIEGRLNWLVEEMARVAPPSFPPPWSDLATLLLTHPSPPRALRAFRKAMLFALRSGKSDERFIDRLLDCISAADKNGDQYQYLSPIRDSLITFVGTTSRRPGVAMAMVARMIYGTEIEQPLKSPFSPSTRLGRQLRMNKAQAGKAIGLAVGHVLDLLLEERSRGPAAFASYSPEDLSASLEAVWLAYTYCGIGAVCRDLYVAAELRRDFKAFGFPLWMDLDAALRRVLNKIAGLEEGDLSITLGKLLLAVESSQRHLLAKDRMSTDDFFGDAEPPAEANFPTHLVCRKPIVDGTDKYDVQEISRHRVLERPVPVVPMPSANALKASCSRLCAEFPWADVAICTVFDDLHGRANLGVKSLTMPATLFVGRAGAGKSRLALRIAEELGLPRLDVSLSGSSDTKILGGTSRGWASGRPSDLVCLMSSGECASAVVLLDEIDKARDGNRNGGGVIAYLLPLLEPETARRSYDSFLKTECDFSHVSWICTANTLSDIPKALQSRLRILLISQPQREHLPIVCEGVIAELEKRWQVPAGTIPPATELGLDLAGLASARQVRVATEVAVTRWARSIVRH